MQHQTAGLFVPGCLALADSICGLLNGRGLMGTNSTALGHHNPKQKIQYHLKLKQELEEMRREVVVQLREKFLLEQCIRWAGVLTL